MTLGDFPEGWAVSMAVVLGLLFGSFANVVIHRLPLGLSVVHPGSRCPACAKPIRAWNNLPVVSWLLLLGRSGCCGTKISPRYPLVEAIGGGLLGLVMYRVVYPQYAASPILTGALVFLVFGALTVGLLCALFIDLEEMILPDSITLGGTLLGVLSVGVRADITLVDSLVGAAAGFVVIWVPFVWLYPKLRGRQGMGGGDANLVMLAGAWFGWPGAVFALMAGAVQGTVIALAVLLLRGKIEPPEGVKRQKQELLDAISASEGDERAELERLLEEDPVFSGGDGTGVAHAQLPFGPFLVLAILEYMFLGEGLIWDGLTRLLLSP